MRAIFVLPAVTAVLIGSSDSARSQQTFRAGVDMVHFSVVVTDKEGAPIGGLTKEDFEIVEEGTPQTISFFAEGDITQATALGRERPMHLGLALDTSGSMQEDIADVRTASIKFLNANEHAEDVTIVDFDTQVRLARYDAADYARLIERIRGRDPDGWTALYDAIGIYLHDASEQTGEKILLVYTDGGDTRSAMAYTELLDLLRASDVTVYMIGYLDHQLSSARMEQRAQLQRMADITGGEAFFPTSIKEVEKMYERIQRTVAARYTLAYVSSDTRMDGNWRKVEVRLRRKDLKGARLKTRDGYYAPYRQDSGR